MGQGSSIRGNFSLDIIPELTYYALERELSTYWGILMKINSDVAEELVNKFIVAASMHYTDKTLVTDINTETFDKHICNFMRGEYKLAAYLSLMKELTKCVKRVTILLLANNTYEIDSKQLCSVYIES